jgi:hypothetical protein
MKYPIPKRLNCPITKEISKKKSKYRNEKVIYQGITFDSIKEKNRYIWLKDMERLGQIEDLRLQVKYELIPGYEINGKKIRNVSYIADFTYYKVHKGDIPVREPIVEDCKGYKTEVYKIKKKMFEQKYQIEISEV